MTTSSRLINTSFAVLDEELSWSHSYKTFYTDANAAVLCRVFVTVIQLYPSLIFGGKASMEATRVGPLRGLMFWLLALSENIRPVWKWMAVATALAY